MNKLQLFFEYLVEHPGALKLLGILVAVLFTFPYIILASRIKQIRRIRKAYDDLIVDQTKTITSLYRSIMDVQGTLAKTRGELDQKIAHLKNATANHAGALEEIALLEELVKQLKLKEKELSEKLKQYENLY